MIDKLYKYKARVLSVYDADTMTLLIDVGFNIHIREKVRSLGIDTPELRTKDKEEKKAGYAARDYVRDLILGHDLYVSTEKKGKFGRYLVNIWFEEVIGNTTQMVNLNERLIEMGHAREYHGEKKVPWKDWD